MAINLYTRYPNNTPTPDPNYPAGKARNETVSGNKDYFPLEADWVNELLGFFGAILDDAGAIPDGVPESAAASQYYDAIKALPVPLSQLTDGTAILGNASMKFGSTTYGRAEMQSGAATAGRVTSYSEIAKSNSHTISMTQGVLKFEGTNFNTHEIISILYPIDSSLITEYEAASPVYVSIGPLTFTGLNFGVVYRTELVLKNSTNCVNFPLWADYVNSSGSLRLNEGQCCKPNSSGGYTPSLYTCYLHMWIDPNIIS